HPFRVYKAFGLGKPDVKRQRHLHRELFVPARRPLPGQIVAHHQVVQARRQKRDDAVLDAINNRLDIVVERGVEQHADPGDLFERVDYFPIPGVGLSGDGVDSGRAVHVRDRTELLPLGFSDFNDEHQEWGLLNAVREIEIIASIFLENGGGEWAVALALLHHLVDAILVGGRARVGQNAAVAERARAELRAALHPADDRTFGHEVSGLPGNVWGL